MRKIEQDMLSAIRQRRSWSGGGQSQVNHGWPQTNVMYQPESSSAIIYLHGHHIATWDYNAGRAFPNLDTFRNYPSRTTCSRLKALGINAHIKNYAPHIDGEPV